MKTRINLRPNQTIVFIGDSITDAERNSQAYKPLGFGYVHFVANWLSAKKPELKLNIINAGISGNSVRDLKSRWKKDCIDHRPDILSVLIGINDLGRQYEAGKLSRAVYPDEYESTYRQLLSQAKQQCNCRIVLMEPFMFCNDSDNQMFKGLREYITIIHRLAEDFDAVLVRLQNRIDDKINQVPPERWSDDAVHPYLWAHAWIAQQWIEIVEP